MLSYRHRFAALMRPQELERAVGPANLDPFDGARGAEAEQQAAIALGEIAGAAADGDVVVDVTVDDQQVLPPVEVPVEERGAESEVELAGRANAARRRDVEEEAVLVALVKGELLAAEVGDQDCLAAVAAEVGGVD